MFSFTGLNKVHTPALLSKAMEEAHAIFPINGAAILVSKEIM
jgi:hypothetical protein